MPSRTSNDKPRGFHGVPSSRLAEQAVAHRSRASIQRPVVPPSQDAMRAAIESQLCPFCGAGPFKMLPVHTNKVHGVDKWELRELAGLTTNEPLCAEDVRAKMSDAAKRNGTHAKASAALKANGKRPQRWTAAGRRKTGENLARWVTENPEEAEVVRKSNRATPEGLERTHAGARAWHAVNPRTPEQRAAFGRLMQSPENVAKRAAGRTSPDHGTTARYKRGCRCEGCRTAKRDSRQKN